MTSPFAPVRRPLAVLLAVVIVAAGSAFAQSTIDPSRVSTVSATVWQFLVTNSAHTPAAACYRSGSHPDQSYTCMVQAIRTAKLDASLQGTDPVTLFAATDAGFEHLAKAMGLGRFATLMDSPADLKLMLQSMMVAGSFTSADLQARASGASGRLSLPTLAGGELDLTFSRFPAPSGQISVAVGSTLEPRWKTFLTDRTTVLTNGTVVPLDMVPLPDSLR